MNKFIGVGRLGKDPEKKSTSGGVSVCEFSIAIDESFKDKDGNRVNKTEWVRIIAWKKLADICAQYLEKGKLVLIEGKLQEQKWEDKDGVKHSVTKVVAQTMKMLDSKKSEGAPDDGRGPDGDEDVPY